MFVFFFFGFLFSFFLEFVHEANEYKDTEGNSEKIDSTLDEVAISDLSGGGATKEIWNHNGQMSEIDTANNDTNDGHEDVGNEGADNFAEGTTNDDTNCEVDDTAAVDKFFKFFKNH